MTNITNTEDLHGEVNHDINTSGKIVLRNVNNSQRKGIR
jgi:hypothetical protein